jgi:hypothetical protein
MSRHDLCCPDAATVITPYGLKGFRVQSNRGDRLEVKEGPN